MSEPLLILGICGVARSGKDTIARHLANYHGFFRIGLADGPRSTFTDLDGPTWELRKELEAAGKSQRWAVQTIGTECREDLDAEEARRAHWCHEALIKIRYLSHYHPVPRRRFVFPDVRFPAEPTILGRGVERWGGHCRTWRVTRRLSGLAGEEAKHKSETSLDAIPYHALIENDRTIGDLLTNVDWITRSMLDHIGIG
jgi:hypothetical protein